MNMMKHLVVLVVVVVAVVEAAAPGTQKDVRKEIPLIEMCNYIGNNLRLVGDECLIAADPNLQTLVRKEYKDERQKCNDFDAVSYKKKEKYFLVKHVVLKICNGNSTYQYREFFQIDDLIIKINRPADKAHPEATVLK